MRLNVDVGGERREGDDHTHTENLVGGSRSCLTFDSKREDADTDAQVFAAFETLQCTVAVAL